RCAGDGNSVDSSQLSTATSFPSTSVSWSPVEQLVNVTETAANPAVNGTSTRVRTLRWCRRAEKICSIAILRVDVEDTDDRLGQPCVGTLHEVCAGQEQATWLILRQRHHSCGTAPGSHRTSLALSGTEPSRRATGPRTT